MTKPNVLLVVMDSVRAENVSLYGHENETMPRLEEFAQKATVYEHAYSPGTWSLPAHVSLFTGLDVEEHRIIDENDKLQPGQTIFETLRDDHGYDTGVFSENSWLTEMDCGLRDPFETVEGPRNLLYPEAADPSKFVLTHGEGEYLDYLKFVLGHDEPLKSALNGIYTKLAWDYPNLLSGLVTAGTSADVYTDLVLDWTQERDGPWAACVNYMDPHLPYEPKDEFDHWGGEEAKEIHSEVSDTKWEFIAGDRPWWQHAALEGLYDGAIRQTDHEIHRLLAGLEQRGELEDTLVVVTADHGEGFGEIDQVSGLRSVAHGLGIDEGVVRVPLVVKQPHQTEGRTVEEPVSLREFPSVVSALAEDDGPEDFTSDEPVVASSNGVKGPMKHRAVRYIDDETLALYDTQYLAVYREEDGALVKYMTWDDEESAAVEIRGHQQMPVERDDPAEVVRSAFEDKPEANVKTKGDGIEETDDAVMQRLEDLGYA
ncbi:sulfatase [Halorussus lipolyticus]|uniref:sulfatase n=1 Tax=Halorussus lipolyticus TaxID=3034024 RepID=UPI0023E8CCF8|nr:sulfatase-like hydrolase/transferase [Halorussus sp. DT80]